MFQLISVLECRNHYIWHCDLWICVLCAHVLSVSMCTCVSVHLSGAVKNRRSSCECCCIAGM